MASAIDVNDPDLRVSKTCQACRAIKLRCVRQADSSKCARCDRLELDCRFVEKKRGRKPKNSQGSSSVKQEIPSPPRVRSPSHSQSAGGNSPPTPSTNTTFSPANQHNQVHHLNQQHQQPQSQQQHHPHQHLPQQSQHQQLPSTLSHSHMDPAAASLAPFQSVLAHPSLAPQSTAPPHPTTQPEPDHHHLRHPASAAANSSLYMADDPVKAGLISSTEIPRLFEYFMNNLNVSLALFDPVLHTPAYCANHKRLYTAILTIVCRFILPSLYPACMRLLKKLIAHALVEEVCTVEFIQALLVSSFWREPDDHSAWRNVGIAVRLAYQLSLHKPQARPLPADSLLARAVLNKERTFLHLIIADLYTLRLCEGPYMVPTEHYPKALDWLDDHPHLQSDCDAQTVSCLEMQQLLKLVSDIRSVIFIKNDLLQVEQLLQHAELLYTNFYATWLPGGTRCASLNPRAAMMIRLLSSSLRLDLARLRYHFQHRKAHDAPFSASNSHMLDIHMALRSSMDCALELLRGLVVEMRPENDILPLLEGVVPAGNWLIEHLNELDGNHQAEVVAVMKAVVSTCRALSHSSHDSHAHYTRSFESILQTCFAQLPLLGMTMQSNSGMYGQVNDPLDSNSNTNGSSLSAPPPSATSNGLSSGNAAPHMPMDEIWRDFMPGLGNHLLGWFDAASQQVEDTFQ